MAYNQQARIKDRNLTAPPAGAKIHYHYLIADSATDEWAGEDGKFAVRRNNSTWSTRTPVEGDMVWVEDEDVQLIYDGSSYHETAYRDLNVTTLAESDTILTSADVVLGDSSGGVITVGLYAASGNSGRHVWIKKTDGSANVVTVDPNSTEKIDGADTYDLTAQYESIHAVCDGTGWQILSHFA